jgi:ribosomal protein S18 acetylase RimI-like enzyme
MTNVDSPNLCKLSTAEQFEDFFQLYIEVYPEKQSGNMKTTLKSHCLSDTPLFSVILAYLKNKPVGFMVLVHTYSTNLTKKTIYLEEFYVSKVQQRKGTGRALFDFLKKHAAERDFARIEWSTKKSNEQARAFYENYVPETEWLFYKLTL